MKVALQFGQELAMLMFGEPLLRTRRTSSSRQRPSSVASVDPHDREVLTVALTVALSLRLAIAVPVTALTIFTVAHLFRST